MCIHHTSYRNQPRPGCNCSECRRNKSNRQRSSRRRRSNTSYYTTSNNIYDNVLDSTYDTGGCGFD